MFKRLTFQKELANSISDTSREVGGTEPSKQEIMKNAESFVFLRRNLRADTVQMVKPESFKFLCFRSEKHRVQAKVEFLHPSIPTKWISAG